MFIFAHELYDALPIYQFKYLGNDEWCEKVIKLKKSPDIISRGSVYLRESQDLLRETRFLVKDVIEKTTEGMHPVNIDYVKDEVSDALSKFIFQHTAKRPIVIPVVICI
jgi:ribonuclease J